MDKDYMLPRKNFWLSAMVLVGLGMMLILLSGCGSDSTQKDAASGKKEKAGKSAATAGAVGPILVPQFGTAPPVKYTDQIPGLGTYEEIEAKRETAAWAWEKLDPKEKVLAGFTKEQLEERLEAERAKKTDPSREIVPGLTMEQVATKLKEHRERSLKAEIIPGFTLEQMEAKAAQARQMQETRSTRPEDFFPSR